ncbi:hypothetical protein HII28_09885 [Planctomonas sp. JC2975]|uniref:DUF6611 family protein n=1 Tax=Planctomonas sp. JC2975 TaxID=2729626 RepID=UPI00147434FA|nr:DUF6611 family protein [Planctomonas sp. JC2975]NNC12185.1 hypothetical protein [Planctomonas sp. JC2975]
MTTAGHDAVHSAAPSRLRRIVAGPHPWGRFETRVLDRTGSVVQHVLVIYPPGTNDRERAVLWFARTWPLAGALAGIGAFMCLGDLVPSAVLTPTVFVVYAIGLAVALVPSRRIRGLVRRVVATEARDARAWCVDGRIDLIRRAVGTLDDLDRRAREGEVDPVDYEFEWGRVYGLLRSE